MKKILLGMLACAAVAYSMENSEQNSEQNSKQNMQDMQFKASQDLTEGKSAEIQEPNQQEGEVQDNQQSESQNIRNALLEDTGIKDANSQLVSQQFNQQPINQYPAFTEENFQSLLTEREDAKRCIQNQANQIGFLEYTNQENIQKIQDLEARLRNNQDIYEALHRNEVQDLEKKIQKLEPTEILQQRQIQQLTLNNDRLNKQNRSYYDVLQQINNVSFQSIYN